MLGFYFCEYCGKTHDDWIHGHKLLVCGVCKTRESIQYNGILDAHVGERSFLGLHMSKETQDMIRSSITGENIFDLDYIRKYCIPELAEFVKKNSDEYIKFAYYGFKDPEEVWNDFYNRDRLEYKGIDVLSYMS